VRTLPETVSVSRGVGRAHPTRDRLRLP